MRIPIPFKKPIKKITPEPVIEPDIKPVTISTKSLELAINVSDILAPGRVTIDFNTLQVDSMLYRTLFVSGYPRFVVANWLSPVINFDHSLNIAMFIYPVESKSTLDELRRKIAEMEAELNTDMQRGRVVDPAVQAKLEDALSLQEQLVKGIERYFQFSLYATIPAESLSELETTDKQIRSVLGSLLLGSSPALLEQAQGFKTTMPISSDYLSVTRNMDTTSLATTFPFTSSELTSNEGIMYGINEHNGSLVIFDRFSMENANSVIFAKAGAGKCLWAYDKVFFDDGSGPRLSTIGSLIDDMFANQKIVKINKKHDGVINPGLKVWTFDKNLKGIWANVTIAAKKRFSSRNKLYTVTTKSGRQITVTADHQMTIMRNGKFRIMRLEAVKIGERIPLARRIPELNSHKSLSPDYLTLLGLITSEGYISPKFVRIFNTDSFVLNHIDHALTSLNISHFAIQSRNVHCGYHIGTHFAKQVIADGADGKSGEKRVPNSIFSLSNHQIAQYLKAYYEGDGGVENHEVSATTKSKDLASDLAYLLLRFGIIARIKPRSKAATNTIAKTKNIYYRVSISGKNQLQKFAAEIGFLTDRKNNTLANLLKQLSSDNTNVDTIPTLAPIFAKLVKNLYPSAEIKTPQVLIDIKNYKYDPSPTQLIHAIKLCESRISELNSLKSHIDLLRSLPSLAQVIRVGSQNFNTQLWSTLGASWRIMKQRFASPFTQNVLLAYQTISGTKIALSQVNTALYEAFKDQGQSLQSYDHSLWSSLVVRKSGNSKYKTVFQAAKFIDRKYRSTQLKIRHTKTTLDELKLLANSDLYWDPITKIEKIKHNEKYVYDLQVDNGVFLAGEGGMFVHNSYMVKLEILRSLMFGIEILVIDPENEYKALCDAVGGEYINFSFSSKNRINPFDLSALTDSSVESELNLKIQSLHSMFKVIMGVLNPTEDSILDRALIQAYKMKGITPDVETQKKTPPLMEDLYKSLIGMEEPLAQSLADRIEKFVKGSFAGIIDRPSNVTLKNPFTVFSVRDLEDSVKPIAIFMILDYIWTKMRRDLKKRILVIDEAWYLMRNPDSAAFMYGIAKRCRKYFMGLTTVTQDVEDFLASDYGKPIVTNSSIQVLMKQSPAAIDKVQQIFYLSEGEKHLLLAANIGEGLFFAGNNHVAINFVSSPDEHTLITTRPQEVIKRDADAVEASATKLRLVPETDTTT